MRRSVLVDLDLDPLVDQRADVELGEAGVAAGGRVEGGDPHQTVDAALGGEEAVGVLAAGDEGGRLQPRLLPRRGLLHLDLEAAPLGPAQVHPQQHLGPVLRVGSARTGVDGDDGIAGVVLAAEQPRLFEPGEAALDRGQLGAQLGRHLLVFGRHLGQIAEVVDVGLEPAKGLQPALGASVRGGDPGGGLLVIPETGPLHLTLQPLGLGFQRSRVKGSPRAGTAARGQRPGAVRSIRWRQRRPSTQLTQRRSTVLERSPASDQVAAQLEEPSHLVLPRRGAILVPMPDPPDQRDRPVGVLVQLVQLDRLLHPTGSAGRPQPRRLPALAKPLLRMKLDLRIEHRNEPIQIALVESPDELANGSWITKGNPGRGGASCTFWVSTLAHNRVSTQKVKRNPYRDCPTPHGTS